MTKKTVLTDNECIRILKMGNSSIAMARAIEDAILEKLRHSVRDAALEEAATLMDQTSRSSGAALIRARKSTPASSDGKTGGAE